MCLARPPARGPGRPAGPLRGPGAPQVSTRGRGGQRAAAPRPTHRLWSWRPTAHLRRHPSPPRLTPCPFQQNETNSSIFSGGLDPQTPSSQKVQCNWAGERARRLVNSNQRPRASHIISLGLSFPSVKWKSCFRIFAFLLLCCCCSALMFFCLDGFFRLDFQNFPFLHVKCPPGPSLPTHGLAPGRLREQPRPPAAGPLNLRGAEPWLCSFRRSHQGAIEAKDRAASCTRCFHKFVKFIIASFFYLCDL